jgi:preprotein translocase subunit SecA
MLNDTVNNLVGDHCPEGTYPEQWNIDGLKQKSTELLGLTLDIDDWLKEDGLEPEIIETRIVDMATEKFKAKGAVLDDAIWRQVEKSILLQTLDHHWKEHLSTLDALRQVIYLRAYAQKTPINEYKREAFELFSQLLDVVKMEVTRVLMTVRIQTQDQVAQAAEAISDLELRGQFLVAAGRYLARFRSPQARSDEGSGEGSGKSSTGG